MLPVELGYAERDHASDNRFRLISLRVIVEVIHMYSVALVGETLGMASTLKNQPALSERWAEAKPMAQQLLRLHRPDLEGLGLYFSMQMVDRIIAAADSPDYSLAQHQADCAELDRRLQDELQSKLCLYVAADRAMYYTTPLLGWQSVLDKFPTASADVEEASKCIALNRHTAAVFHLMRVAELGLTSIAKRVGLQNARQGWDEAIGYIEGQLRKNYNDMDALFKGDVEFLSGIAAHMRNVNLAWRRRVAHIERSYSEEEAVRIYSTTRDLMQHVATKLGEVDEN